MSPNFLMICSDQHRYDCVGVNGNRVIKTPNLDKLALDGTNFSGAFTTCPVCTPARASFLNGQWSFTHGCLTIPEFTEPQCRFDTDVPLIPKLLAERGYTQSYIGKWHLGDKKRSSFDPSPLDVGYDRYIPEERYNAWIKEKDIHSARFRPRDTETPYETFENRIDPIPPEHSRLHWGADQTIQQLKMMAEQDKPFFLRWDPSDPHLPCIVPEACAAGYDINDIPLWGSIPDEMHDKPYALRKLKRVWELEALTETDIRESIRLYYANVTLLDKQIGRILEALDQLGLREDTVVIYTADHGDMCGSHGLVDKHYNMYDDIVRVPLILRYPGVFDSGKTASGFVRNTIDLAFTICELAGIPVPDTFQGQSLQSDSGADSIVSAYHGAQFGLFSQRMLRDKRYKYVYNATDIDELYDLDADPWELHNIIFESEHTGRIARMRRELYDFLAANGDPLVESIWTRNELKNNRKLER